VPIYIAYFCPCIKCRIVRMRLLLLYRYIYVYICAQHVYIYKSCIYIYVCTARDVCFPQPQIRLNPQPSNTYAQSQVINKLDADYDEEFLDREIMTMKKVPPPPLRRAFFLSFFHFSSLFLSLFFVLMFSPYLFSNIYLGFF